MIGSSYLNKSPVNNVAPSVKESFIGASQAHAGEIKTVDRNRDLSTIVDSMVFESRSQGIRTSIAADSKTLNLRDTYKLRDTYSHL